MADSVQDDDAIQVNPTDGVIQICHSPADAVSANILLLDVGLDDLKHEIASSLGVSYLDPAPEGSHQQVLSIVNGCVYGPNNREMLALPVAHISGDPLWVIFLYDSGAPVSQFSKQAWNALGLSGTEDNVIVGGYTVKVHASPKEKPFYDINLLGQDLKQQLDLWCMMKDPTLNTLYFFFGVTSFEDVQKKTTSILNEKRRIHLRGLLEKRFKLKKFDALKPENFQS